MIGALIAQAFSSEPSGPEPVQYLTWSQSLPDGQVVQLRGELPDGYPTETWLGSKLLDRDTGGDFGWDLVRRVPEPISMMDGVSCDELLDDAYFWMGGAQDLTENGLIDASYRQLA